jgi:hypothetical protein
VQVGDECDARRRRRRKPHPRSPTAGRDRPIFSTT